MLNFQSAELLKIPAFVKLFRDAFPEEAAMADANEGHDAPGERPDRVPGAGDLPAHGGHPEHAVRPVPGRRQWRADGANGAARSCSSPRHKRQGGAGCFSCHSGPMLNKQADDPDVAGIGQFVEENFFNVGIGDHPVQALNAAARGHLDPPTRQGQLPLPRRGHRAGRDHPQLGRRFKFRSLTLRQLKDARTFFHNGSFTKIRDVVQYFNAGIPQDPTAGAALTLSARFTHPRGPGSQPGLGLTNDQVDDLTDFLENALYDPAFVKHDPNSSTRTLQLNERDVTYSKYRPDLAALGARDGFVISGLASDNNDPLSRRDQGLEFLDVSPQTTTERIGSNSQGGRQTDQYKITNKSQSVVDTHLLIIVRGLSDGIQLENASGNTRSGDPYIRVFLPDGVLQPGQNIVQTLIFRRQGGNNTGVTYVLDLLSGQGNP